MLGGLFKRKESKPDLALDPGFDAFLKQQAAKTPSTPRPGGAAPPEPVELEAGDVESPSGMDPVKMLAAVMSHPEGESAGAPPPSKKSKAAAAAAKAHRRTQSSMPSFGAAATPVNPLVGTGEEADPVKMLGDVISGGKSKLRKTNLLEKLMSGGKDLDAAVPDAVSAPTSPERHRRAMSESVVDSMADTWELMIMKESANYMMKVECIVGTTIDSEYEAERKERSARMARYLTRTASPKAKDLVKETPVTLTIERKSSRESFSDKRPRTSSVSSIPEEREEVVQPEHSSHSSSAEAKMSVEPTTPRIKASDSPKKALKTRTSDSVSISASISVAPLSDASHATPNQRKLVTRKSSGTAMKMADVVEKPALESRLSGSRGSMFMPSTGVPTPGAGAAARAHRRARSSISMGDSRISTYAPDSFDMLVDKKKVVVAVAEKGSSEAKSDLFLDDYFPEKP